VPVIKQWQMLGSVGILTESVRWQDIAPKLADLPTMAKASDSSRSGDLAKLPFTPAPVMKLTPQRKAFQLAQAGTSARGVVLDYTTVVGGGSYTFANGTTYYLSNGCTFSSITFNPGAVLKYETNGYLAVTEGTLTCNSGSPPAVCTCANDGGVGQPVGKGDALRYDRALVVYSMTYVTVNNIKFRWANIGPYFLYSQNVTVHDISLEQCATGIKAESGSTVTLSSNDTQCNVAVPTANDSGSTINGSLTVNCGTPIVANPTDASSGAGSGTEGEPAIAVNPMNPSSLFMAANFSSDGANVAIYGARSGDGGVHWSGATLASSYTDPSVAFDRFGNLFLSYIPPAGNSVVIQISTDGGQNFTPLKTISKNGDPLDQPSLAVGPGGSQSPSSVWVTYADLSTKDVSVVGAPVTGLGTVGTWTTAVRIQSSDSCNFGGIAVGRTGQVAVVFQQTPFNPNQILVSVNPYGLTQSGFSTAKMITTSPVQYFQSINATLRRGINAKPSLAWDCTGGLYSNRLYMVYTDQPSTDHNNTDAKLFYSNDNGANWTGPLRVNDDVTSTSQFFPRVAVDQTSGKVAVSWYDCREDTTNDRLTRFYGAVSTDGGQTFSSNFQIESGSSARSDASRSYAYEYFDYTGLAYYGGYFYPAWADNSNSAGGNTNGINQMDIYVGKVGF
jgi:hypothetical protein